MNNQQDNKEKPFRIKTLEELNQDRSRYKGKVTGSAKYVKPIKSVDELNRVNKKSTINYGRAGDENTATAMNLDDFQYPWEKEDENLRAQQIYEPDMQMETSVPNFILQGGIDEDSKEVEKEHTSEPMEENITYSANGLNFDYLQSLLDENEQEKLQTAEDVTAKEQDVTPKEQADTVMNETQPENIFAGESVNDMADTEEKREEIEQLKAKIEKLKLEIENAEKEKVMENPSNIEEAFSATTAVTDLDSSKQETEDVEEEEAVILEEKESITLYKVVKEIMTYTICIGIAVVLAFVLVAFVVQKTEVIGESMEPTLNHQEQLVIDKISYRFTSPKRFDIVVFPHENTNYIKRVIGLPGETVSIEEGYIYIDGQMLYDDTYGMEAITSDHYYSLSEPVVLGDDEYFVMGDNRNNSKDSRDHSVGNITKDQMIGRVIFRIWPFEKLGTLD